MDGSAQRFRGFIKSACDSSACMDEAVVNIVSNETACYDERW